MTGAWLLANGLKQISDCTGGRKMQFDTASQNNLIQNNIYVQFRQIHK